MKDFLNSKMKNYCIKKVLCLFNNIAQENLLLKWIKEVSNFYSKPKSLQIEIVTKSPKGAKSL